VFDFLLTGINGYYGKNNISLKDGASLVNPDWFPPITTQANIVFFGAVILNGGVYGSATNPIFYGNLYMDCAKINSYNGVKGSNVIFEIDAIENSNGDHPNSFICKYAFNICYYEGFPVGTIYAKGNYWEFPPTDAGMLPPPPYDAANIYSFKDIAWGEECGRPITNNHTLDYSQAVDKLPEDCFRIEGREDSQEVVYSFAHYVEKQSLTNHNITTNLSISIYPNPTTDYFTVSISDDKQYKMTIMNIYGQKVLEKMVKSGTKVNTTGLESGMYIYKITDGADIDFTGKLVIQN